MKKLSALLVDLGEYKALGDTGLKITSIEDDSRNVKKGSLFVAIKGLTVDGHKYISQAVKSGAVAIVGEKKPKDLKITFIKVKNSRRALGFLASAWYGNPSKKLKIIGVTGTDGKTTTSNIIYWLLLKAGEKVGLISTVGAKIGKKDYDTGFHVTNPEPLALHKFLAKMVDEGCKFAVIEVTSHGLDQERDAGIDFNIGILTNVAHEHLDYHKTLANYMKAKAKLFNNAKLAILNSEDSSFAPIQKLIGKRVFKKSYNSNELQNSIGKVVKERFPQDYNQLNASAAIKAAREFRISDKDIVSAIKTFPKIEGRMEEIDNELGLKIIIDFAHTPNALSRVLTYLGKNKVQGRLIAVIGCAGERDIEKRPLMSKISTNLADFSVFTAEDPRGEDVNKILRQMESGVARRNFKRVVERGEAITYAINNIAARGDTVIICGKGHEQSMNYGGVEYPWSDKEAVELALKGEIKRIVYKT